MASLNRVMIIGNLGGEPEMRYTTSGDAVTTFSVATNESWTSKSGEKQQRTEWFNVVAWGKLAENCAQYLSKGRSVFVEGRQQTRSWDGQDGQKHYKTELVASNVTFLGERDAYGGDGDIEPNDLPF